MATRSGAVTGPIGRSRSGAGGLGPMRIGMLLVVLAVMAAVGYWVFVQIWGTGQKAAPDYSIGSAARQTVTSITNASGTVSATRQIKIAPAAGGKLTKLYVKQGDTVEANQVIAELDPAALQLKVDTTRSQLESARLRLQALLEGPTQSDVASQLQSIASAQSTLTRAENDLANLLAGSTPEDIATARANLDRATAALEIAQTNYDKLANGVDLTLRSEYSALQSAKAEYQSALTTYNNRTTINPNDVTSARATVSSAQAQLDSAQAKLTALLNPNPADIASAQAAVTSAQAQLDSAQTKYRTVVIGASIDDRENAQAAVDSARAALLSAETRRTTLSGDSSAADSAAADASVAQAQVTLAQAESNLRKLQGQPAGADHDAALQAVRSAETGLTTAQNNLNKLLNPNAADLAAAQQQVSSAQSSVTSAQSNLDKLLNPNQDDIAQARASLDRAEISLATAQTNWDRLVNGTDLGTRQETTALNSARADYQSALAQYTTKTSGPRPGDVAASQTSIDSARAGLAAAQARLAQIQAGSLPTDIGQSQESVRQLELSLKAAEDDLANSVVKAPFAGTIITVPVNEGDQLSGSAATIATLVDPALVRVDATLDESSVSKVKAGQTAIVTFDAIAGRQFTGQISVVTPAGVTQQGVVTFPVAIVFNSQGVTIPSGLTATVRIVTERKDNVVVVPSRAIKRQGRDTVVDVVLEDGALETRQVQTGLTSDGGMVEITSGLNDGDRIAIPSTQARTSTTTGGAAGTFGAGGLPGLGAPAAAPRR